MAKYVCVDIHTVRSKDTFYSIAKKYDMNVDLLMRVNGMRNPYDLQVGTRLCIPGMILPELSSGGNAPGGGMPDGMGPGFSCRNIYTVKPGDTLYMIAKMHKITLDALMDANPGIDPYQLQKGMELCIPE